MHYTFFSSLKIALRALKTPGFDSQCKEFFLQIEIQFKVACGVSYKLFLKSVIKWGNFESMLLNKRSIKYVEGKGTNEIT